MTSPSMWLAQVPLEDRGRGQVVEGHVEETLDLPGVQVDADHPVGAGGRQHVGHQLGGDGLAAGGLAVLAGVAVVGADGGDALGRGPLGGVDHDQLLHQRVVHRAAVGLDDEDVAAPDGAVVAAVDLAVGELPQVGLAEVDPQVARRSARPGPGGSARRRVPAAAGGSAPRPRRYRVVAGRRRRASAARRVSRAHPRRR